MSDLAETLACLLSQVQRLGTSIPPGPSTSTRRAWRARLFESLPSFCPNCGAHMRIIAFITEATPVERILDHIGEPSRPPPIAPARGPPARDDAPAPLPDWDLFGQAEPDVEYDQRIAW